MGMRLKSGRKSAEHADQHWMEIRAGGFGSQPRIAVDLLALGQGVWSLGKGWAVGSAGENGLRRRGSKSRKGGTEFCIRT